MLYCCCCCCCGFSEVHDRNNQNVSSKLRSQLNSVTPFLPVSKPKWLKRSLKCASLAFSFSNLWNNNFLANSYNSVSKAFNFLTLLLCFGAKWFNVELDTVTLCWSNGMAKRKLNVSSKTYWDICKIEYWKKCQHNHLNCKLNEAKSIPFDIQSGQNKTWQLNCVWHWLT